MTNMFKVLSIVSILIISISTNASEKAPSRLNQVRNSLWVFGVDNKISAEPEIVEQAMMGIPAEDSEQYEANVVPEELEVAIFKTQS